MSHGDIVGQLKSQSTWRLVFLSLITLGIYGAYYIKLQTKIINQHLDREGQISATVATFIVALSCISAINLVLLEPHPVETALLDTVWSILVLIWVFKARNRMNMLLAVTKDQPQWFHGLWTFIFFYYYFNFKINRLNESIAEQGAALDGDSAPLHPRQTVQGESGMKPAVKGLIVGGGLAALVVAGIGIWLFSRPLSGVRLGAHMDQYALHYIAEHNLLQPGEEVLAYYDVTMAMDGTEAAILTKDRVIYHKDGLTNSISIQEIDDVQHRYQAFPAGDIIEIRSASDRVMIIEIAAANEGGVFKNLLMYAWQRKKNETPGD